MKEALYIGLMSGTSMDAIDAVLVEFPPDRKINVIATHSLPLSPELKCILMALAEDTENSIYQLGKTDTELGIAFATCCVELLAKHQIHHDRITAIGSHGQTILHVPDAALPFTIQIGDPNIITAMTNITTVADFRRRDLALGGQAAPLAPAFHHYLFGSTSQDRMVINIGGIANLTFLQKKADTPVTGFDTGPGNTLLDAWCWQQQQQRFDNQGRWAASGQINRSLLTTMLNDPYFKRQSPKSVDRNYFNLAWLQQHKPKGTPEDIQATLTELTVISIANAVRDTSNESCEIFICGGGIHNTFLLQRLQQQLPNHPIKSTESIGLHPNQVEAATFAWLARQTLAFEPGNLPSVTGARQSSILGAIYPAKKYQDPV